MKLKFVLTAFAAVAMFAACEEQALIDGPDGPGGKKDPSDDISGKTTATFVLNLKKQGGTPAPAPGTKLPNSYAPDREGFTGHTAADEQLINTSDVRLMIFDNTTQVLEYNGMFVSSGGAATSATATVVVTAGSKKIFVFANAGPTLTSAYGTQTFDNLFDTYLVDVTTLTDFYNSAVFDAGIPQYVPTFDATTDARTFDISQLHTQGSGFGFPASTTNQYSYQLKANISETDSQSNPGGEVLNGTTYTQDYNNFTISLVFMLAKARLTYNSTVTTTPTAEISTILYSIRNLAKTTNYVMNVVGNLARSFYYGLTFSNDATGLSFASLPTTYPKLPTQYSHFLEDFDGAATISQPALPYVAPSTNTAPFLYVTESTNAPILQGQVPYYAISAKYMPKDVVATVTWDPVAATQKTAMTTLDIQSSTFTNMNYYYLRGDFSGPGGTIVAGTCFKDRDLMRQAVWLVMNGSGTTNGGWDPTDAVGHPVRVAAADGLIGPTPPVIPTPAELLAYPFPAYGYYVFEESQSYYRAHVGGEYTTPQPGVYGPIPPYNIPKWGAVRGTAYDTNITSISGPGVPYEWMLDVDKPDPVDAMTNVTVVVEIQNWVHATQVVPLQ